MDLLLLLLVLAVFLLPSFFMMRSQKKRQQQVTEMQYSINAGDRIVTVAGFHATVVATRDTEVDLELAPGTIVTMERQGIMRKVEETPTPYNEVPGSAGAVWDQAAAPEAQEPGYTTHPENLPADNPQTNPDVTPEPRSDSQTDGFPEDETRDNR
ncbi:preprotein translocase subunit YajC [Corynebacterium lubricantis]|uniref:preprotein translocase subunit YajC n=1 Tax=Corynebacterium lubricantis TaxID=541095 RepID=UPI000369D8DA|nr:preprotein translocase subunit YajC [Corynebacterium lubricantis]